MIANGYKKKVQDAFGRVKDDISILQKELSQTKKQLDHANKELEDISKERARVLNPALSFTAKKIFFTKGVGKSTKKLESFENALRDADIAEYNLVRVSSIFPPNCEIILRNKGIKQLNHGQIVFCVMADISTNEPNRLIASSIGLARPTEKSHYGYISEHHSYGENESKAGDYAEDLAATMLASTLGIDFDLGKAYDERKEVYRMSGKIVESRSTTKIAYGDKKGLWTTVLSAAVFVP